MPVARLGLPPVAFAFRGEDETVLALPGNAALKQIENLVGHFDLSGIIIFGLAGIEHNRSLLKVDLSNAQNR